MQVLFGRNVAPMGRIKGDNAAPILKLHNPKPSFSPKLKMSVNFY